MAASWRPDEEQVKRYMAAVMGIGHVVVAEGLLARPKPAESIYGQRIVSKAETEQDAAFLASVGIAPEA